MPVGGTDKRTLQTDKAPRSRIAGSGTSPMSCSPPPPGSSTSTGRGFLLPRMLPYPHVVNAHCRWNLHGATMCMRGRVVEDEIHRS